MAQVRIQRRSVVPDPADPAGLKVVLAVTYSTAALMPQTVYVPGESPSDEQIVEAIRQDIAARTAAPPATLEV